MTNILNYMKEIFIVTIPAIIIFLCFRPYRMRALKAMKLQSTLRREIGLILFISAIFSILALTLWPTFVWEDSPGMWGNIRLLIDRPAWNSNLSLIPFTVFRDYIEDLFQSPVFFIVTLVNFLGNLAIFVPIGFFPALLFRRATCRRSMLIGFGMSLFIEIGQYFIMRNSAVDDVILNTVGSVVGYAVYKLFSSKFPHFTQGFLCSNL